MTGLTATTDQLPMLWVWMFLTGLGIGPAFSVLTIVVQSVVPFEQLGVATGNLTFFRQIGGSVGLAIVGTLFANGFTAKLVPQLADGRRARRRRDGPRPSGATARASPRSAAASGTRSPRPAGQLQVFADQIVKGIYEAFSLAIASTFWLGVIMGVIALVAVVVALPEVTLRGMGVTAPAQPATTVPTVAAITE